MGTNLAAQAAEVEEALAEGDADRARREADELVAAVRRAIDRGEVPAQLADELLPAAEHLASVVPEPEAPPAPPPPPPPPASPAPPPPPTPPPADEKDDEKDDEAAEGEEQEDDGKGPGKKNDGKGKGRGKGNG